MCFYVLTVYIFKMYFFVNKQWSTKAIANHITNIFLDIYILTNYNDTLHSNFGLLEVLFSYEKFKPIHHYILYYYWVFIVGTAYPTVNTVLDDSENNVKTYTYFPSKFIFNKIYMIFRKIVHILLNNNTVYIHEYFSNISVVKKYVLVLKLAELSL